MFEQLLPALGGAGLGAIGGLVSGITQARAATKVRRRVRRGVLAGEFATARQVGTILTSPEFQAASGFIRSLYGMKPLTGAEMRQQMIGTFGAGVTGVWGRRPQYPVGAAGEDIRFMRGLLGGAAPAVRRVGAEPQPMDVLTGQFRQQLRQAQAARGLYGSVAAAAAEASGMAGFRTQLQAQMLPQLLELAQAPAIYAQRFMPQALERQVFRATGGVAAYGAPTQLAAPVSPLAFGMGGLMQGLMGGAALGLSAQQLGQETAALGYLRRGARLAG